MDPVVEMVLRECHVVGEPESTGVLRRYDPAAHHDRIPVVYAESFDDDPWPDTWDDFDEFDPNGMFVVTDETGDELAGYVVSFRRRDFGYISVVAVRPRFRRRGLATLLLAAAVRYLRSLGLVEIRIHVEVGNAGAIRTYEKFGFVPLIGT